MNDKKKTQDDCKKLPQSNKEPSEMCVCKARRGKECDDDIAAFVNICQNRR